jgi:hypothetical protein
MVLFYTVILSLAYQSHTYDEKFMRESIAGRLAYLSCLFLCTMYLNLLQSRKTS